MNGISTNAHKIRYWEELRVHLCSDSDDTGVNQQLLIPYITKLSVWKKQAPMTHPGKTLPELEYCNVYQSISAYNAAEEAKS